MPQSQFSFLFASDNLAFNSATSLSICWHFRAFSFTLILLIQVRLGHFKRACYFLHSSFCRLRDFSFTVGSFLLHVVLLPWAVTHQAVQQICWHIELFTPFISGRWFSAEVCCGAAGISTVVWLEVGIPRKTHCQLHHRPHCFLWPSSKSELYPAWTKKLN